VCPREGRGKRKVFYESDLNTKLERAGGKEEKKGRAIAGSSLLADGEEEEAREGPISRMHKRAAKRQRKRGEEGEDEFPELQLYGKKKRKRKGGKENEVPPRSRSLQPQAETIGGGERAG